MNNISRDCWSFYKEITLDSFHINNIVCALDVLEVKNAFEIRGFMGEFSDVSWIWKL